MGLCKMILSSTIDTNNPTINNACTNTDTVVVSKDKNINRRDISHSENEPSAKNNVE